MAAALPPVNVIIPAGPPTPDSRIFVNGNDDVVTKLPFLEWRPEAAAGGLPRMSMTRHEALWSFAIKCNLGKTPADLAALPPINMLTLNLTAGAWSRLLTAIRDGGMAALTFTVLEELHAYIKESVPICVIGAVDWAAAPPFAVGGNAAVRAAATRIRYLGLANIRTLEYSAGTLATSAPWYSICKLAGALGGVGTQAARVAETALVQTVAENIRQHAVGGATDAALAANLRSNVERSMLPKILRAHGTTPEEVSSEMVDGFTYKLSEADRKSVEQQRVDLIPHWYATEHLSTPP